MDDAVGQADSRQSLRHLSGGFFHDARLISNIAKNVLTVAGYSAIDIAREPGGL